MGTLLIVVAALLTISGAAAGVTIHVPSQQPTIQAGINAASDGDTVLVACDTYTEHGITMTSGITVLSETGDPSCVTIDCTGNADQAFYIIGVDASLIAGFTFTGGEAPWGGAIYADGSTMTIRDCVFSGNTASSGGGGVHWDDGAVTVIDCTFTGNTATNGGGGLHVNYSDATVTDCVFDGNDAGYGGGLAFEGGDLLTVAGTAFTDNTASDENDGGGGAYVENCAAGFLDCTFDGNDGGELGGGLYSYDSVQLTCTFCTFTGNEAEYGGGVLTDAPAWTSLLSCAFDSNGAGEGGAVYFYNDPGAVVDGCAFTGNTGSWGSGGGVAVDGSVCDILWSEFVGNAGLWGSALAGYNAADVDVENGTIVLNRAPTLARQGATIYMEDSSHVDAEDTIIAFNSSGEAVVCESGGTATLSCSLVYGNDGGDWTGCIEGQEMTIGNWHVDPLFCGLLAGDYSLCANSPCLPGNNPCATLMGPHGEGCVDCDSPVELSSWGVIKSMWR